MMPSNARFKIGKNGLKNSAVVGTSAIFGPAALQFGSLPPRHVNSGETAHAGPWRSGAAHMRIGQDGCKQRRFPGRQHRGAMAKRIEAAGLRAETTAWAEFGDIEIDFQNPGLRQDEVEP